MSALVRLHEESMPRTLAWTRRMLAELPSLSLVKSAVKPLREYHSEYVALEVEPPIFTPNERAAAVEVFLEGRSIRAAASHLGAPEHTIAGRIRAARVCLRAWLRRETVALTEVAQ